jgi:hypothetical protein
MTLENNLNRYFGYQTFKTGQEKIVRAAVNGQDVLGIMPTGGVFIRPDSGDFTVDLFDEGSGGCPQ